ncbi:MAG: hypothetical protein GXO56_02240 [Chloroflexi bacterium]|nr:hypothetical protein [Chloroflexota bacterium]
MTMPFASTDPLWRIRQILVHYPIMSKRVRARMRRMLFQRGVITKREFEEKVRELAIESQRREGLVNPLLEEPAEVWEERLEWARAYLTDFYFAYHLPFSEFDRILREVRSERRPLAEDEEGLTFNPELAPRAQLFEEAFAIEQMPPEQRARQEARLQEIKVVLIRDFISDQLGYVGLAKRWLTIEDLDYIRRRKIGPGKIGGKAAGMLLAYRILQSVADEELKNSLRIPESYFLGADVMYAFMAHNDLMKWAVQKYKPEEQIQAEYPQLREEYLRGDFPPDLRARFEELLHEVGNKPLIVRSSSLLEDNFGTAFAGKYESHFVPNQGSFQENLQRLIRAIASVYASGLAPDPLLYRKARGLIDYDERIAILIQVVEGEPYRHFYFPQAAGVAFSRNMFPWSAQIRPEDGFVRLVWGLGTRAVDRVGNDYPRLVALSHPELQPTISAKARRYYSQRYIDLIDLEADDYRVMEAHEVLQGRYPVLPLIASLDEGGYLAPLHTQRVPKDRREDLVITFDGWLRRTPFAPRMRSILRLLEKHYGVPVDLEFAARVPNPRASTPDVEITILQCRPQSHYREQKIDLPKDLRPEDIVLETHTVMPYGQVEGIRYVLFVPPEGYYALKTAEERRLLTRAISKLNARLANETFICVGPGRWGTSNPDLGVHVGYADIHNARALIELSGHNVGPAPEPSLGTHFFQDLMEAQIYPLAVDLDDPRTVFRREFFYDTPNHFADFLPEERWQAIVPALRLIAVEDYRAGQRMNLVLDALHGHAVGFVAPPQTSEENAQA